MAETKSLTTKEVARLCKVSDATVKRWAEQNLLKSERTSGGHRRFRSDEVLRFQRESKLGLKQTHGDVSVTRIKKRRMVAIGRKGSPLFNALIAGSEEEAAELLINSFLHDRSLPALFDEVLASAMLEIGDMWARGDLTVTQEHVATRTAFAAIHKLRNSLEVPIMNGRIAMCCAIEGDLHELPIYLAQLIMENKGWEVINFGANTPVYGLAEEISDHPPNLVCISATMINDPERLVREYRAVREKTSRLKVPVILGGKAFADSAFKGKFPCDLHASSYRDIEAFLNETFPDPA